MKGIVNFFNKRKGFGIIIGEGGKDYYVHQTALADGSSLSENDKVVFDVEDGERGAKAVNVEITHSTDKVNYNITTIRLRIKDNGEIEILGLVPDGTVFYSDGSIQLENNLFICRQSKWTNIIKEFEYLINNPHCKENDLQSFLEEYPEMIAGDDYEKVIPQPTIISNVGVNWKADFILQPKDPIDFCKIIELKLPAESIFIKSKSGHSNFSAKLMHSINQLKDYAEAFNNSFSREIFYEKYKTNVFKPDLQLIFGKRINNKRNKEFLELQRRSNVEISDWDTLLQKLKRKYT